ncbi:MAG TPA: patatin-like phospholipase family protein [Myxococcaceae bacterium]|nr:patatin-like phospholipase family protein [Myxococcaceae bacterium]
MPSSPIALVLSGGGARGAYEAGVVRYLREELPASVRGHVRFDILCGTSVGAITACFLAATMDQPESQGAWLAAMWNELSLEKVYKVHDQDLWTLTRKMWRAATSEDNKRPEGWRLYDILHPEPLEEMVRTRAAWPRISANLAKGLFQAISVSATQIATGRTAVFVQRKEGGLPPWSRDPFVEAREAILGPEHALASAAIPLLFRSVKIGDEYFCDGSLRQNTPLSPALRLGAEKVLIISLKYRPTGAPVRPPPLTGHPTTPLLMGKVLNALMLDHTDYDLDRLRRFNSLLEAGRLAFGADFIPKINEAVEAMRGQSYRHVQDLVLRPSRDIGQIAAVHAKKSRLAKNPRGSLPTKLLHRIAQSQLVSEADLASYLLFDADYAKDLMDLAMEDSHTQREELIRFFAE